MFCIHFYILIKFAYHYFMLHMRNIGPRWSNHENTFCNVEGIE